MKRNLFKATVLKVEFSQDYSAGKTTCVITYYNPITNTNCKAKASARCSPFDTWNERVGQYLAESRAKYKMYKALHDTTLDTFHKIHRKYDNLIVRESMHIADIIHSALAFDN